MKNIKKIIVLILICIILIIGLLIVLNSKYSQEKINEKYGDPGEFENYDNSEILELRDINKYYMIQTIVNSYINSILEQDSETLYNTLDPKYIEEFNVNKENVYNKLNIFGQDISIEDIDYYKLIIDKIYASEYNEIGTYFVYGKIININTKQITNLNLTVEMNVTKSTYYILPDEYINKYNNIEIGVKYETHLDEINNNSYNEYDYYDEIDAYTIIIDHMNKLTNELVYNLDNSYNLFTDEYKKEKFDTLEKYKQYIKNNINSIITSSIEKYKVNYYDDYTQYICIDQYGNYYIFEEKGVMDYKLKLDTYTIDTEEFKDKYNNGSVQLKVGMNLEKIFQALNRKDYEYIYNKLDNTFKTNNFATLSDFENYIKNISFNINKIEYGAFEERSGIYVYNVKISDAQEQNENIIEKNFIIKLEEDTDFIMSFNIN